MDQVEVKQGGRNVISSFLVVNVCLQHSNCNRHAPAVQSDEGGEGWVWSPVEVHPDVIHDNAIISILLTDQFFEFMK